MAPKPWHTAAQQSFFATQMPEYVRRQAQGKLYKFWPSMQEAWFLLFPEQAAVGLPLPSAEGDAPDLDEAQKLLLKAAIKRRKAMLTNWFRNNCRKGSPGTVKQQKSILSLSFALFKAKPPRRRVHKPMEIFQIRNNALIREECTRLGHDELNEAAMAPSVEGWVDEDDTAQVARIKKAAAERMCLRTRVVRSLFAQATEEELEVIAEELEREKKGEEQDEERGPEERSPSELQASIDESYKVMQKVHLILMRMTGWYGFSMWGGPNPRVAGQLGMKVVTSGESPSGNDFLASLAQYEENLSKPFQSWLMRCFFRLERALDETTMNEEPTNITLNPSFEVAALPDRTEPVTAPGAHAKPKRVRKKKKTAGGDSTASTAPASATRAPAPAPSSTPTVPVPPAPAASAAPGPVAAALGIASTEAPVCDNTLFTAHVNPIPDDAMDGMFRFDAGQPDFPATFDFADMYPPSDKDEYGMPPLPPPSTPPTASPGSWPTLPPVSSPVSPSAPHPLFRHAAFRNVSLTRTASFSLASSSDEPSLMQGADFSSSDGPSSMQRANLSSRNPWSPIAHSSPCVTPDRNHINNLFAQYRSHAGSSPARQIPGLILSAPSMLSSTPAPHLSPPAAPPARPLSPSPTLPFRPFAAPDSPGAPSSPPRTIPQSRPMANDPTKVKPAAKAKGRPAPKPKKAPAKAKAAAKTAAAAKKTGSAAKRGKGATAADALHDVTNIEPDAPSGSEGQTTVGGLRGRVYDRAANAAFAKQLGETQWAAKQRHRAEMNANPHKIVFEHQRPPIVVAPRRKAQVRKPAALADGTEFHLRPKLTRAEQQAARNAASEQALLARSAAGRNK
ncbi:hypothetical protein B0H15DRAFT_805718 [Mycena belliarum]|uniref:Uncharacterized protein n=1 Tax=Mycena belliarum TaxID=1033014 RepID=A0AAD6TVV5_9AGAR|nr:hypothetical protein B0H15DRAFT_805718 [Mycena belliae]